MNELRKRDYVRSIPEDSVKITEFKGFEIEDTYYAPSEDKFYKWRPDLELGYEIKRNKDNGIMLYTTTKRTVRLGPKKWRKQWEKDHPK